MRIGTHSPEGWLKDKTARRVFRAAGYTLAGTALAGMTAMQGFAAGPQAVADEAAATGAAEPETSADASVTSTLAYDDAATPKEKNESVYVFANADGTVKNTQVSSKITNPDGAKTLRDATDLSDIENVESDGEYAQSAEGIVWDAQGENVYYKGTATKQAPVSVRVSYELDGQDVSADELAGKSGKVKIRYEFTNHSEQTKKIDGKKVKLYTPFVCITGMILKDEDFKNVEIENGKVIDDGDRSIVVGYTMPGMADSLGIDSDDVDFPEFFEVTADAENFSIDTALTLVTSDLFQDVDTGKIDLGDLSELDKLGDAMDQLIDGSDQLVDGLQQISDGAHTLADGTGTLASGTGTLLSGTSKLRAGADSARNGADQLHSGTNTLLGGLQQFKNGTKTTTGLTDALKALGKDSDTQADGTLIGGVNSIKAGVDQFVGPIKTIEDVAKSNEDTFKDLLKKLKSQQKVLDKLTEALDAASGIDEDQLKKLMKELDGIKGNLGNAQAIIGALVKSIDTVSAALDQDAIAQIAVDAQTAAADARTAGAQASKAASGAQKAASAAAEAASASEEASAAKAEAKAASAAESMEAASAQMQSVESALYSIDTSEMDESQVAAIDAAIAAAESAEYAADDSAADADDAVDALAESSSELGSSAKALGKAASALESAAGTMADDAEALKDSATSTAALCRDVQGLATALQTIDGTTLAQMKGYLDTLSGYLTEDKVTEIDALVTELQKELSAMDPKEVAQEMQLLKTYVRQFNALLKVSDTDKLVDNIEAQITQMASGMEQISNGLSTINGGLKSMRDGGTTADGRTSSGLRGAVAALGDLSTKGTLINGAAQLNAGTGSLSSGLGTLSGGLGTLGDGAAKLDSGAQQLDAGANTLATGTDTAVEGASALADGIKQLNEEGIQKLLDALDNDLLDSVDRFDAIVDLGKDYQTFSGKAKGTEGHVKFIYQTAAVSADDSSADGDATNAEGE